MNHVTRLFAVLALSLTAMPALAADHWVASWGAGALKVAGEQIPDGGVTYRNIVHLSLGGSKVRLTLSNRFGTTPLTIGGASAGVSTGNGVTSPMKVTFGGKSGTVIAPGATILSDPIAVDVPPLGDMAISVFLPAQQIGVYTGHAVTHQRNYRAAGDQLTASTMSGATNTKPWRVLVAVDVAAPPKAAAIVAFGDSITDGTGTTDNANLRWPNQLAARLQKDPKYAHLAVVDEGIGGNRILHEGGQPDARGGQHPSGLSRWSFDALSRSGVKYVVLLEGVNDIGRSSILREGGGGPRQARSPEKPVNAADLIKAMKSMIAQAHAKGIKVIGATMTPYGGAKYDRPDGQETRRALNDFIRTPGNFDGYVDFDAATHDPAQPLRYKAEYNEKDHLHPNDAGAKAMADSVNLSLFD